MRKTIAMALAVVLMAAGMAMAADKMLVEDGTAKGAQASGGGWWYVYNDSASGGNSEVTPAPDKFEFTKDGARMQGKTGNKLGWDFVGMGVTLGKDCGCPGGAVPVDISKFTTLVIKIKGAITGGRLAVSIPYSANKCEGDKITKSLTEWADYETAINKDLSKDFKTVKIDLRKDLKQPKWAKNIVSIEDVLKNAHNVDFHFSSPDGDTADITVAQISFE
jgi:opacity protein-like surface antigen